MSKPLVYVVYYSTYGHVERMAREILEGLKETGVEAKLFQVPETLTEKELNELNALPKAKDVPVIKVQQLKEPDGILFGFPTRFGSLPAQLNALFDATGQLWLSDALSV